MKKSDLIWKIMKDVIVASAGEHFDLALVKIRWLMKEYELAIFEEERESDNV